MNVKTKAGLDQTVTEDAEDAFDSASFIDGEDGEREGSRMTSRVFGQFARKQNCWLRQRRGSRVEWVCLGCVGSKYKQLLYLCL